WIRACLKLHFVCRHRLNVANFFFEMTHRWLLPGRRLDISSIFSTDFHFRVAPQTLFTLAEMSVRIEPTLSRDQIEHNLKVIETEIRLGMVSVYHASRLLETHFTSPQQRNSQIQEKITKLLERNSDNIDYDIFGILQQFMVMSREEFKIHRSASHLSRIITASYLFTKSIERARETCPDKRHVRLKIGPVMLDLPWGPKEVIGVCVGINLLNSEELFEEKHLMRAVQNGFSGIKVTPDSFYFHEGQTKGILVLYLEIEKESGALFLPGDLKRLKQLLPDEICRSVEVPLKSIFMPRNEEEILRYIVALSGQLRFVKDLPQVILMFDEQKGGEFYFTVVLVRILFPTSYSMQYLFGQTDTSLKFIPDRVKRVGLLRKRYPKEATVFRIHLSSQPFLREDQSVDLFRARQSVFQELEKVIGELRDYTGGMIAKQVELIDQVQELLGEKDRLLELFFHALYPVEARSFLLPDQVKNWFVLWKHLLEFPEDKFKMDRDHSAVYVMGVASFIPEFDPSDFGEMQLMIVRPEYNEKYLGYLFVSSDIEEQQSFLSKLQSIRIVV
ncbi:MAG: hypothetical protein ACRDF4_02060, partial [Rhabdochlamydiaceae bacterium]